MKSEKSWPHPASLTATNVQEAYAPTVYKPRVSKGQTKRKRARLTAVKRAALPLEREHDIERGDGLALGVLSVGDRVADDVLEEDLEHASGLFVDQARDTLDTAT